MNSTTLLVGELAREAGVKADTIRFYEREGLLAAPARTGAGYRIYDASALDRVRFIKRAQKLGFTLEQIRQILSLRGNRPATCQCVLRMAETSLGDVEEKLRELHAFRDALTKNLAEWRKSGTRKNRAAEFCALIENSSTDGAPRDP